MKPAPSPGPNGLRVPHAGRDLSAHSVPSLNAEAGPGSVSINAHPIALDLNAFGAEDAPARPVALEVIPPPGAGGVLPARDGRHQRVADPAALVAALNAQPHAARVDFDHRSEPVSPTYAKSTEAEGWLSGYRLNHRGGIDADVELGPDALARVRAKKYRYVSPALLVDPAGDVVGLSSLGLVNNPNLPLTAPSIHSEAAMPDDTDPKALQAQIDALQKDLDKSRKATNAVLENAAVKAVDAAVTAGRILPAQKDYHLGAIRSHADGSPAHAGIDPPGRGCSPSRCGFPRSRGDRPRRRFASRRERMVPPLTRG